MAKKIDLTGRRFGRLFVVSQAPGGKWGRQWNVLCDCNSTKVVLGSNLRGGNTTSCGCLAKAQARAAMKVIRDCQKVAIEGSLLGNRYGMLVVIAQAPFKAGYSMWKCTCDCGRFTTVRGSALTYGGVKCCGCLRGSPITPGDAAKHNLWLTYRASAVRRTKKWALTEAEFFALTKQACHYCGVAPWRARTTKSKRGNYVYNGIDRVNNHKGYIPGNVVPCCSTCNMAKGIMSYQSFMAYIHRLVAHHTSTFNPPSRGCNDVYSEDRQRFAQRTGDVAVYVGKNIRAAGIRSEDRLLEASRSGAEQVPSVPLHHYGLCSL